MNNFKRPLSVLLAGSVLLTCLTACDEETASSPTPDPASGAAESGAPAELVQSDGTKRIEIKDGKFVLAGSGKEIWFNGANTPWDNWNDFGTDFDEAFWDSHFADLHAAGVNATRVWITCDGDAGVKIKSDGTVTGAKDEHWADLDSLFALAAKHEVYIMATLMSFDHCKDSTQKHTRWRAMIQDEALTQTYIDTYVIPFVERYDSNDYLFSIDICNEPDWIYENQECGKIQIDYLSRFFGHVAAAIHENSDILVTVGMGMVKYNSDKQQGNYVSDDLLQSLTKNENAYLDYYSPHFYEWQISNWGNAFMMTPEQFGMDTDRPVVLGECPAAGLVNQNMALTACVESAYNNGWDGVFAWTSNGTDDCGGWTEVSASAENMLSKIPELIFPDGQSEE